MSAAIEVGLGLAFLYFVFASFCSGVNEGIARLLNSRGKALFSAVNALIDDGALAQKFWNDKLITSLAKAKTPRTPSGDPKAAGVWPHNADAPLFTASNDNEVAQRTIKGAQARALPSYIPPETFATALVHTYKAHTGAREPAPLGEAASVLDRLLSDAIVKSQATPGNHAAPRAAAAAAQRPSTTPIGAELIDAHLQPIVQHVATWFDNAMDRLSGMYKRRVQLWLAGLSLLVVGAFNLNTVHVAQQLWREPALRAQIGSQVQSATAPATSSTASTGKPASCLPGTSGNTASVACAITEAQDLPVGWAEANRPKGKWDIDGWLWAIVGWLLSLAALSLGAPFWFSVLGKLSSLRSTGPSPPSSSS